MWCIIKRLGPAGVGSAMNSSNPAADLDLDGLSTAEAKNAAIAWLERRSLGQCQVCILDHELHGYYSGGCTTLIPAQDHNRCTKGDKGLSVGHLATAITLDRTYHLANVVLASVRPCCQNTEEGGALWALQSQPQAKPWIVISL